MNAARAAVSMALAVARDNLKAMKAGPEPWHGYATALNQHVKELEEGLAELGMADGGLRMEEKKPESEKEDLRLEKPGDEEGWK